MRAHQFISEKAVSKKQQQFFGIVRAMQKGDMKKSGEAGEVAKDISKADAKDFAKTKHKGLPTKKTSEEAAGVGIVTKQNATADVPVGGEYMNVKKLFPKKKKKKESIAYEDMFQGLNPKSEIYVDMDGVLADFFSRWQKITGKNWRDIKGDDLQPALQAIRDDDDFWLDLPLTSNAKKLLSIIKQVKGSYKILSAPLAGDKKAEPHKREWVAKNLDFFPPTEVIITKDKAKYATNPDGTPNILIDDYGVNIAAWESAGGIGFKHKDHKFERTAKKLKAEIEESFQHLVREYIEEGWSKKYKDSINCSNPKGFSQKAHCAGRKKKAKESYTREELPQIKNKHLENIDHEIVFLNIDEVKPVQKERVMENFKRQVDRLVEGVYSPVVVDCDNRIINGHHRYDAVKLLGETTIPVARIPHTLECMIENFADGKKKGKSRPGRVKRSGASCNGSVTALRKRAKNASGEKAKMYHWCANMKSGRKKK